MTHALYILAIAITALMCLQVGYDNGFTNANGVCRITCEVPDK